MIYHKNFNLKKYNSFHLQSVANHIWFPESELELINCLKENPNIPILSYGTNVLLRPQIEKLVCLRKMPQEIKIIDKGLFRVKSNVLTNVFINEVIKANYTGIEGLFGLPGSIGAAIVGNAGSGKYCISDYLLSIISIDYKGLNHFYTKKELKFERRTSILQNKYEIIIEATFQFNKKDFNNNIRQQTIEFRNQFPKGYSAGGLFKNWHVLKPYEKEIRKINSPNLKISKLLNVIINDKSATYQEIIDFIEKIQKIVKKPLQLEVKII